MRTYLAASLKTQNGWGYVITLEEKIIIKNNCNSCVISENKSFKQRKKPLSRSVSFRN
jgi:hypothetical protein